MPGVSWCCAAAENVQEPVVESVSAMDVGRVLGLSTCCGPEGRTGDDASNGCCFQRTDGEVIHVEKASSDSRPYADLFDEKAGICAGNGVVVGAEAKGFVDAQSLSARDRENASAPADFSGSWCCDRVSGDMEAFLTDMGLGVGLRKAAAAAKYGAGVQVQHINQSGDFFEVENILRTPVTMQFRVGLGEQNTVDQVGKPIIVDPRWEGNALFVASRTESGQPIADSKRYFEGDAMVIQFRSPQGTVVERIFKRGIKPNALNTEGPALT